MSVTTPVRFRRIRDAEVEAGGKGGRWFTRVLGRIPRAALLCAVIALVHGALWAAITPPLQGPDEPTHISYVEYIVHTGTLPSANPTPGGYPGPLYSKVDALLHREPFSGEGPPTWSPGQQQALLQLLRRMPGKVGADPFYLRGNPPLYYALDAGLVKLSGATDERTRIFVMRLGSALMFAVAAFFVYLFVREIVPRPRWAPLAGGLAFAFHPVAASLGGYVNPEIQLAAAGAALLWLVARIFRRGLTTRRAVALAAVAAAGMLSKTSMAGLLPGAALACLLVAARTWRTGGRRTLLALAAGAVVFGFAMACWFLLNDSLFDRPPSATAGGFTSGGYAAHATWRGQLSYIWQFYLPRLPFQRAMFGRWPTYPVWQIWIQGFEGRFAWHQYQFPQWVQYLGLPLIFGLLGLVVFAFRRVPGAFRRRLPELASYAAIVVGLLFVIHYAGYRYRVIGGGYMGPDFEQARYTLSVWGLYALAIAVAVRGLGQRWGKVAAAFIIGLVTMHALAAQFLTFQRFFG